MTIYDYFEYFDYVGQETYNIAGLRARSGLYLFSFVMALKIIKEHYIISFYSVG